MNPYDSSMLASLRQRLGCLLRQRAYRVFAALLVALGAVHAPAAAAIRVLVERPHAVEGAPFLVPVRIEGSERGTVALRATTADGAGIACEGRLLWPVRPDLDAVIGPRWAAASNELRLVAERPANATDAYLAIELPAEARGATTISLPNGRIEPRWLAPAPDDLLARLAARVSAIVPEGAPDARLSLPDPDAPFERFRFTLGCALRGWPAPAPLDPASPDCIAARATTAIWLAALARVAKASEGTAAEFAEALVATCREEGAPAPIAAWIADPVELATLLSLSIDASTEGEALVESIVSWFRVRSPLILWIEEETRDAVVLAIANPTSSEEVVRISWLDSVWLDANDAPLAALVPPAESLRVRIPRPARSSSDAAPARSDDGPPAPRGDTLALRIEHRGQAQIVTASPEVIPAGVAGPVLVAFRRPLTLVSASSGAAVLAPDALRTFVSLRPRLEGWEVFAEVRCPNGPSAADAITVVGADGSALTVRGDGSVDDPAGLLAGATVEWKAYKDRFRLGFQLPPAWIDRVDGRAVASIGVRRIGAQDSADAPFASVPWRRTPRAVAVDLLAR